jgi:FdhD protein
MPAALSSRSRQASDGGIGVSPVVNSLASVMATDDSASSILVPALPVPYPSSAVGRIAWRGDLATPGTRTVPAETPVALTYARSTHAVMLATPADLEDFAVGFSLAEGIILSPAEIVGLEVVALPDGVECRMDLGGDRLDILTRRQRRMAGPSGCGLCGLDSIAAATRPAPAVPAGRTFTAAMIRDAMQAMHVGQALNASTHAVHAAGFWTPVEGLVAVREDVGRHNALDKLTGALARTGIAAEQGIVLLSSRVSVEMVQKAAIAGAPVLAAISAPTSLAIKTAAEAGITLVGVARTDGCEVFTRADRIVGQADRHGE